jgi:hypothetical protein
MRPRPKLSYANVMSTLCFFLLLGGGAYAAGHLGKNSVGAKQLRKNAVTTAKVKNEAITAAKVKKGSLTGTQINVSTLAPVPTAQTANVANSVAPSEGWHVVGAPGEPSFDNGWNDSSIPTQDSVAFYKDREGIVHLRGFAKGGNAGTLFQLPTGFRPGSGKIPEFLVGCEGVTTCNISGNQGVAELMIFGSGISAAADGAVFAPTPVATAVKLDGVTFRAES